MGQDCKALHEVTMNIINFVMPYDMRASGWTIMASGVGHVTWHCRVNNVKSNHTSAGSGFNRHVATRLASLPGSLVSLGTRLYTSGCLQAYFFYFLSDFLSTPVTKEWSVWAGCQVFIHWASVDTPLASSIWTTKNCKPALLVVFLSGCNRTTSETRPLSAHVSWEHIQQFSNKAIFKQMRSAILSSR